MHRWQKLSLDFKSTTVTVDLNTLRGIIELKRLEYLTIGSREH